MINYFVIHYLGSYYVESNGMEWLLKENENGNDSFTLNWLIQQNLVHATNKHENVQWKQAFS
jgi:exonuclease I